MSEKIDYFVPGRDDWLLSDESRNCPGVVDFLEAVDFEDVLRWRGKHLTTCRECEREPFCYPSLVMQGSKAVI